MELKFGETGQGSGGNRRSNRTFMELKYDILSKAKILNIMF